MNTETVLGLGLVASLALNAYLLRVVSRDREAERREIAERESEERFRHLHAITRTNEPGARAHADCTPGQPCVSGRGECPYERTRP